MSAFESASRLDWDQAFAGNRLLATFSPEARALLEPYGELCELKPGDIVFDRGQPVENSLFPIHKTMVSLSVELAGGRKVEVASIGREGAVGGIISCGHVPAFSRSEVLVGGPAMRLPMDKLEAAKKGSPFVGNIFCRFADYLLAQVMQSVACNAFHSIPERAARWLLLAQDRAGDRLELTQESFADLLGVQRTTVNAVIKQLQDEQLVATSRGVVRVTDRIGLKRRSCECYSKLEDFFAELIGSTGAGAPGIGCED